jgi:glutamine amidotransferase
MSAAAAIETPTLELGGAAPPVIGIVDYGMGNLRSVEKAVAHIGARPLRSSDVDELGRAGGLIVPGVGAFPKAMRNLRELGLDELIRARIAAGTPTLGICLGMQLAFESSTELGGAAGLGILAGEVRELRAGALKLPHIGWNPVRWHADSPLIAGIPDAVAFYHVHSFIADPARSPLGSTDYGETFATAVSEGSFFGVQFHPEKSSLHGLRLLANFAGVVARIS